MFCLLALLSARGQTPLMMVKNLNNGVEIVDHYIRRWNYGKKLKEKLMNLFPVKLLGCVLACVVTGCSTVQSSRDGWSGFSETGKATYYADKYQNKKTASGEPYQRELKTAAHKQLPFGTNLKVTNLNNGKSVVVRVNDRGPFIKGRIVDLSKSAFSSIGNTSVGVLDVEIEVLD